MNKAILIGRVGKDPETRTLEGGAAITSIAIATSEKFKDREGNMQESTEWHNVKAWNNKFAQEYVKKGDLVMVEGKLETRSWETQEGEKRYITEINAFKIEGLAKAGNGQQNGQQQQAKPAAAPAADHLGPEDELPF